VKDHGEAPRGSRHPNRRTVSTTSPNQQGRLQQHVVHAQHLGDIGAEDPAVLVSRVGLGATRARAARSGRLPAAAQGRPRGWANIVQNVQTDKRNASEMTMARGWSTRGLGRVSLQPGRPPRAAHEEPTPVSAPHGWG